MLEQRCLNVVQHWHSIDSTSSTLTQTLANIDLTWLLAFNNIEFDPQHYHCISTAVMLLIKQYVQHNMYWSALSKSYYKIRSYIQLFGREYATAIAAVVSVSFRNHPQNATNTVSCRRGSRTLRTQNSESFIRLFNKYIYSLIILYR